MLRDIGLRLLIGLVVAALIQVAVPDEFFLSFGSQPLLQMLVILVIAIPMYICSTGSIPVAAALMMKGLSPGAALISPLSSWFISPWGAVSHRFT